MKSESKQLEIIQSQIIRAMDIVLNQKKRYEELQSQMYKNNWTCEDDGQDNEIAEGLLAALGSLENIYEHIDI